MIKSNSQTSFSDISVSRRKLKSTFFTQIDKIIDWSLIDQSIRKFYQRGKSVDGRPSYSGLLLFKMTLLQTWYNLSDYEVEAQVNDSLSFMQFTGLKLEDKVPDHSVISRFRTAMTKSDAYDSLLQSINDQLEKHSIIVKQGCIVDASVTVTPRKPKGKKEYEVVEDRKETDNNEIEVKSIKTMVKHKASVDTQGAWLIKAGKFHFGYKRHVSVDDQNGLVTSVITTSANESDMNHLIDVVEKGNYAKGTTVKADKGYQSEKNQTLLREKGYKQRIMKKALKGKPMGAWQKKYNQIISSTRFKIERTFGGMSRWFGAGIARYIGLKKTHTQHLMEAISYNLYRSPGIIMSITKN